MHLFALVSITFIPFPSLSVSSSLLGTKGNKPCLGATADAQLDLPKKLQPLAYLIPFHLSSYQ